ncbi:HAD-IIA family hydrolase [Halodesulfovibrio marinisediminis]|uniref:NagD protein n=1 Tax=Halodesulfovibrio marinisediminis DSM 17456 TaxID=1121457 RepID=A0A1N6FJX6_9BACT|nr:HAD-IIA family hydrolase [Halodesulfovibrio marinisediminis]SIN95562.1 NagD protein [Halodesulfovibrio marinisediminis DSM 17456]
MHSPKKLFDYSTFIFDLDGCIHFGNTVAEGAPELLTLLRKQNKNVLFLSNNSTHSPETISKKLEKMGVDAPPSTLYLASTLTSRFVTQQHGISTLCVAGTDDLISEFTKQGHTVVLPESDVETDILILGRDLNFDFTRLKACANRILKGAIFYACNADLTHPSLDGGKEPETGALAAAVTAMTGIKPQPFGKPEAYAYECIMQDFNIAAEYCLMVGDNPATDIQGARTAGMDACWLMLTAKSAERPKGATHIYRTIQDGYEAMCKHLEQ